jgi:hypothetical protein
MREKTFMAMLVLLAGFQIDQADSRERSAAAKDEFKRENPCPTNGNNRGPCPGQVIDHVKPLDCGGSDAPTNMQWQSVEEGKAKDKWERKNCRGR